MNAVTTKSRLRAVTPKAAQPSKPKILVYGKPGVGKTWGSTLFPVCYFIDAENGANLPHYTDRLAEAGGMYLGQEQGSLDFDVVISEVKALATEKHPYKTLIIDSISKLYNTVILHEQIKLGDKDAYGASKRPAIQRVRNLLDWIQRLDMNVIFVAQEKDVWGPNGKEGVTFDCDEKLAYDLHLILNITQAGTRRIARIGKSRLAPFPSGETFEWSYDGFAERYGRDVMEAEAKPVVLATESQVQEVKRLLEAVKVSPDYAEKCLSRGQAGDWSEMDAEKIEKVISDLRSKIIV